MPLPSQTELKFSDFASQPLEELLSLQPPPFIPSEPFQQLQYIYDYVGQLGCKTIILEPHYIDRHYIEDHSVLYSRNFTSPENYCRRLHFFSTSETELKSEINKLLSEARRNSIAEYKKACADLSARSYLGFCVIKPLDGTPVGRTVLRGNEGVSVPLQAAYPSTRFYTAHLAGCELRVKGLAFQQQDVGVSACATTALWSSLQQTREFEEIRPATPAQITSTASQYLLPDGKPIPSEGLSVEQMCQATQSLGVPPNLIRVLNGFENARAHLHSATLSGFAPVIIMQHKDKPQRRHAVTVTGVQIDPNYDPYGDPSGLIDRDLSAQLRGIYIHDDRIGPYVEAEIFSGQTSAATVIGQSLFLRFDSRVESRQEWLVTHLLIPMHAKIRLSFAGIRRIAHLIIRECGIQLRHLVAASKPEDFPRLVFETRIERSTRYIENLVFDQSIETESVATLASTVPLSRYVGVIKIQSAVTGSFEILVDTTSTIRNINYLALVVKGDLAEYGKQITEALATECRCQIIS